MKVQKQSHVGAKKLPNIRIKSNSRVCLGIKSTKRILSPAPKSRDKYFHLRNLIESPFKFASVSSISDGLHCNEIKITRLKQTKKTSFFKHQFKKRILIVENSLNDETVPDKMVKYVSDNGLYQHKMHTILIRHYLFSCF
jgi:hypothetical protein